MTREVRGSRTALHYILKFRVKFWWGGGFKKFHNILECVVYITHVRNVGRTIDS